MVKLISNRLIIRDYNIDDLEKYPDIFTDENVTYYLQNILRKSTEEYKERLMNYIDDQKSGERKYYFFGIEEKYSNDLIGEIGYAVSNNTHYGKLVHLRYFIKKYCWNKGYTTEALQKVLEYAFEENNVYRIHTGCYKENIYSERIMIKCGFIKEAEFKEYELHDGKLKDRVEYRLLRSEWKK